MWNLDNIEPDEKLAVMFFIHGGGWFEGITFRFRNRRIFLMQSTLWTHRKWWRLLFRCWFLDGTPSYFSYIKLSFGAIRFSLAWLKRILRKHGDERPTIGIEMGLRQHQQLWRRQRTDHYIRSQCWYKNNNSKSMLKAKTKLPFSIHWRCRIHSLPRIVWRIAKIFPRCDHNEWFSWKLLGYVNGERSCENVVWYCKRNGWTKANLWRAGWLYENNFGGENFKIFPNSKSRSYFFINMDASSWKSVEGNQLKIDGFFYNFFYIFQGVMLFDHLSLKNRIRYTRNRKWTLIPCLLIHPMYVYRCENFTLKQFC